jgi:hypothetical protein
MYPGENKAIFIRTLRIVLSFLFLTILHSISFFELIRATPTGAGRWNICEVSFGTIIFYVLELYILYRTSSCFSYHYHCHHDPPFFPLTVFCCIANCILDLRVAFSRQVKRWSVDLTYRDLDRLE